MDETAAICAASKVRTGAPRLILASASPRRSALLRQVGADFCAKPADVDETAGPVASPAAFAERAALRKAEAVAAEIAAENLARSIVVGADTIVVAPGGEILGKPADDADAERMLTALEGRWHEVVTGLAIVEVCGTRAVSRASAHESTRVLMRSMDGAVIRRYVATGDPRGKAGAYAIQGVGAALIERVDGCYTNVVGLPLARLSEELKPFGLTLI